jgi:hypothetical protein
MLLLALVAAMLLWVARGDGQILESAVAVLDAVLGGA